MLRHACGYKLANDGHDTRAIQAYLGHRNIQNTTRYTALAPQRFKEFFRDGSKVPAKRATAHIGLADPKYRRLLVEFLVTN